MFLGHIDLIVICVAIAHLGKHYYEIMEYFNYHLFKQGLNVEMSQTFLEVFCGIPDNIVISASIEFVI